MNDRPFSAATSKYAYAQAFAGPSARRHSMPLRARLHASAMRRMVLRGRDKTSSS